MFCACSDNNQRRGRELIAEAGLRRANQAKRTKQLSELEHHNRAVYGTVAEREAADRARRERLLQDPKTVCVVAGNDRAKGVSSCISAEHSLTNCVLHWQEQAVIKAQALCRGRLARKRTAAVRKQRFEEELKTIKYQALYREQMAPAKTGQLPARSSGGVPGGKRTAASACASPAGYVPASPSISLATPSRLPAAPERAARPLLGHEDGQPPLELSSRATSSRLRHDEVSEADNRNSDDFELHQASDGADSQDISRFVDDGDAEEEEEAEEEAQDEEEYDAGEESQPGGDESSETDRGSMIRRATSNQTPSRSMESGRRPGDGTKTAAQRLGSMLAQLFTGTVQQVHGDHGQRSVQRDQTDGGRRSVQRDHTDDGRRSSFIQRDHGHVGLRSFQRDHTDSGRRSSSDAGLGLQRSVSSLPSFSTAPRPAGAWM